MAPNDRERIFEPGYSTQAPGSIGARGVGLPLVRRTVERRGGSVRVPEGADGCGGRFEADLPEALRPIRVGPLMEQEARAVVR